VDESIQTKLAPDSAQSSAPDNPDNCAKSPFIRPKLEYIEFFEKYTRAAYNVAQVWSLLVLRAQRNKPGSNSARLEVIREGGRWGERAYWYLHTPEDMARECGKSVTKIESALKILKRLNMVEARAGRHPINGEVAKYRGLTVTHIRLGVCARGNGLDSWPTVEQMTQMRIIPGMAEAVLISSAEAVLLLPDTKEGLDTEEEKQVQKQTPVPDVAHIPESTSKVSGKKIQSQNPTPEVLEEYTEHEALKTSPDYWRYELWTSLMSVHGHGVPAYVKPQRLGEYLSMLQRLDHRVTEQGEDTLETMLDCMLGSWVTWRCAFCEHGYDAPVTPTIAFLTKYAMKAYGWADDEHASAPESTPAPSAPVAVGVAVSEPAQAPASPALPAGFDPEVCDYDEWLHALATSPGYEGVAL
jgi:hypothetical protein